MKTILSTCAVTLLLLTACIQPLDIDEEIPAPTLVLNSVVLPDAPLVVQLSHTARHSQSAKRHQPLKGATLSLSVDGQPYTASVWQEQSDRYVLDFVPQPGQHLRLEAHHEGQRVVAELVAPTKVNIEEVRTTLVEKPDPYIVITAAEGGSYHPTENFVTYHITFQDPPQQKNFYFLRIIDKMRGADVYNLNVAKDPIFQGARGGLNLLDEDEGLDRRAGVAFSDELIDGQRYELKIEEANVRPDEYGRRIASRTIQLYAISEDYYRYLRGIFNESPDSFNNSLVSVGLAEPAPHHSNIIGGTGIFGALQLSSTDVAVELQQKERQ